MVTVRKLAIDWPRWNGYAGGHLRHAIVAREGSLQLLPQALPRSEHYDGDLMFEPTAPVMVNFSELTVRAGNVTTSPAPLFGKSPPQPCSHC